jgi:hypothetical protein
MKKIIYSIVLLSLAVLIGCEQQQEFGLAQSQTGFNFRMIPDVRSFNLADPNPTVNFTMYSETGNIRKVDVVVELFQFLNDASTARFPVKQIDGSALTNDGSSKLSISLQEMADAVNVDVSELGGGDVFTIINVVELENGNVYPDTLLLGGEEFINSENSFSTAGATTSYTAQLNFPMVCSVSSPFTGTYTISDDCGLFGGTTTLTTVAGNPTQREFLGTFTIAGCCSFDGIGFAVDLVCGRVFVQEQSVGLGCGGGSNVDVVTSAIDVLGPGAYDDADDSQFTANVFYSNPDCFGGFDCTVTFTKQ